MSISHTSWSILEELYGKDIKDRIYSGKISDGELYDICYLMDADYRYVLMQRDDYVIDKTDPPRDPKDEQKTETDRKNNPEVSNEASAGKEKSADKNSKKESRREAWHKEDRENNKIIKERFDNLLADSGYTFEVIRRFIGISVASERQMFEHKTFEKGVTATIAWIFETTPEYLEGRTNDMHANAEQVVRPILSTQDFMINSTVLQPYSEKIKGGLSQTNSGSCLDDDLTAWLMTGDRLVAREFAEKIAQTAGLHITAIRSFKKRYESDLSIAGIAKCQPNTLKTEQTDSEKKAENNNKEKGNSPSEKDLFALINSLTDEKLDLIIKYVQSVKEIRSLEKQFQ